MIACGRSAPEADPAKVKQLAAKMAASVPAPVAVRECKPEDLAGGPTLTHRTLLQLAQVAIPADPQHADWINPPVLDVPAARTLVDPSADSTAARRAAAELLAAPFWIVYHVDIVNAPIALGVKELKIGTVTTRVIRYERSGLPGCVQVFAFQNDQAKSDWAIARSDRAYIDPAVSKAMRDDLAAQYIAKVPRGAVAAGSAR